MNEINAARAAFLRQAIAYADEFRSTVLNSHTDDAAYWWRTRMAEQIFVMRQELFSLTKGNITQHEAVL